MSRTYKDKSWKLASNRKFRDEDSYAETCLVQKFEHVKKEGTSWGYDRVEVPGVFVEFKTWLRKPGYYPKLKRTNVDPWAYWYRRTPSWWIRQMNHRPKRKACNIWETKALRALDLEDFQDCPDFGRKPHIYYW